MLDYLWAADVFEVGAFFLFVNIATFVGSVAFCWGIGLWFGHRRIFDRWEPLRGIEVIAATSAVILNAAIGVLGCSLWQAEIISIRSNSPLFWLFDCMVMILAMDLGMYWSHRLAHFPAVYRLLHRFHHRHATTNPISLFVLHPLEVLGFGGGMILFLCVYSMSLNGLLAYLFLNVLFGTIGHSGVEPFPASWGSIPVLRLMGTSTFHAGHHTCELYNFGFYTLLWDKLFGTLDPEYTAKFSSPGDKPPSR